MGSLRLAGGLVLALVLFASPVPASIIGSALDNGDGTFTYSFTVANSSGDFDVSAWSLDLPFAAPDWDPFDTGFGGDVTVPDNWVAQPGTPVTGLFAQDFISLDPSSDVLVGTTLGGFSFKSSYRPGTVSYYEFSALGESATGSTTGPAQAVPEPRAALVFALGLVWVAFSLNRRARGLAAA
ncbi:MAG TPA: hypothetical protein VMS55_03545 [Myxococcota bacterium]|nr:hypothetical protein [Myxococcota bacterium]